MNYQNLFIFFLLSVGVLAVCFSLVTYNSNYALTLLSNLCRARLAYREAGALARTEAWERLDPAKKQVAA